ncbi:hypothetical protein ACU8NH_09385 [Rhizobium leguminosarum]
MTTMIERVAMAIYAKNAAAALGRQPWAKAQEASKDVARGLARAALEEMREPTEGMMMGMFDAMSEGCFDGGGTQRYGWEAAINAALKEES